ncbi:hypothetical protein K2X05_11140 [bacterium]|nr:hypothetical protein [bacterium]
MKSPKISNSSFQVHISFPEFENELEREIKILDGQILEKKERLFISSVLQEKPVWSQCTWKNPEWISIESINDAVKKLKAQNSLWMSYCFHLHRRTQLIQEKLLRLKPKPLQFLKAPKPTLFGGWALWEDQLLLASAQTTSALPLGLAQFEENKSIPSRAYLKLWELFTLHEAPPKPGSRVLDLGSSPGGWTWVLSDLECDVISVDKAPLDNRLMKRKNISHLKKDAFTLSPDDVGGIDVLFSDIICEPKKLYDLTQKWMQSGRCKKIICSIKFKGETDFDIIRQFKAVPHSRLYHLCANKHELTWVWDH